MIRPKPRHATLCASAGAMALLLAQPAVADTAPQKQPGHWAQGYTGRKADPAVLFGTLPNGLRYAIMRNTTPADGVAMRMRIGSGSLRERDEEQGLAHYLEHMAFRGSAHIADGEVVHMLERQGLRFGPDTNAGTSQDETVYMFTFPRADANALDTGLTLFREIGERLNIAPAAVEAERGVILSEERLRDVPAYQEIKADLGNALAGTRAVARWPIGRVDTIKAATPQRIRRFYEANYRPDNATLVIVGHIDPAKVEAEIKARFADWKPAHPGPIGDDALVLGAPAPANPAAEFIGTGAPDHLTLDWVRAADSRAETEAVDREQLLQLLGLTVLNDRLADRAGKPGAPYVGGQAGLEPSLAGVASLTELAIAAAPEKWREALAAITQEQRHLLQNGVTPEDLHRAITQLRTAFQVAAANAPTRTSSDIADALVKNVNEDQLFASPAQDLALAEDVLKSATPDMVNAALRLSFAGNGPVLFRSAQAGPATVPVLGRELAADYAAPLAAQAAENAIVWPYGDFGTPGAITAQTEDKALGTTTVSFANGARLIVKPTTYEKDQVAVSVALGHGRKGADPALAHALWASQFAVLGGTGKLSLADITRWAEGNGKVVSLNLEAGIDAFRLTGATRAADLASQMQLLAAFARDPGFRPEMGEKLAAIEPMISGQMEASAGTVFTREQQRLTGGGDSRYASVPATAEVAATRPEDLPALLRASLAGPADVAIVGDISVADAIAATRATFGAAPPAQPAPVPDVRITLPAGQAEPFVVTHGGRADQAYYGEVWALPDYFADPALSYAADVTAAVLQTRLVDTVREKLGMTYAPQAGAVSSISLPGQGYLGVTIETPPANFNAFRAVLDAQIAALAATPISADELERAKKPLIEARTKAFETNAYWLARLPLMLRDPRTRTPTLEQANGIKLVTAEQVRALLSHYVVGKPPLTIIAKARDPLPHAE